MGDIMPEQPNCFYEQKVNNLTPIDPLLRCTSCSFALHKRNDEIPLGVPKLDNIVKDMVPLEIEVYCRFSLNLIGTIKECPDKNAQKFVDYKDYEKLYDTYVELGNKYKDIWNDRMKYATKYVEYETAYFDLKKRNLWQRIFDKE